MGSTRSNRAQSRRGERVGRSTATGKVPKRSLRCDRATADGRIVSRSVLSTSFYPREQVSADGCVAACRSDGELVLEGAHRSPVLPGSTLVLPTQQRASSTKAKGPDPDSADRAVRPYLRRPSVSDREGRITVAALAAGKRALERWEDVVW